jgi:2-keto-4-pentenoate hydratase
MPKQRIEKGSSVEALARKLDEAWENRTPIPPLTESEGVDSAEQAYAIQSAWSELRLSRGERIVGRKIGLTSFAMQEQMGVNEPDYGSLWTSRYFPAHGGRVEISADTFLQPRLEGEIAFLMGRPLAGPGVTPQEVLVATEALAVAVEVVDSRIEDWQIKLVDTIADNASYGGFTLGPWSRTLKESDLRTLGMLIHHNGMQAIQGIGAAALGGPARAVAWLANKLSSFGVSLEPGDMVLSGSLGQAVPAQRGDVFVLEVHGQPPLTASFV